MEHDDTFDYEEGEEDDLGDDYLAEEEDLEATVQTIHERARRVRTASSGFELPVTVDDFLRSFLTQMGMTATLDCFQAEWTEMTHVGLVDPRHMGTVPDIYVHNQCLHNELKNALREREEYRQSASASADTLATAQKARDVQQMQHKRAGQERSRLVEETRRVKAQCKAYEPAIRRMGEKYQAVVQQTMKLALERDKILMHVNQDRSQLRGCKSCREMRCNNLNAP
ncbi:sperm-associated antigen 16 protein-like [Nerophis lumbriciformis]|uniref:sperm-associated antigen 16 protein-like n=1 Tax=Nerophis lumbriciformis TaxID=546530 RepID=UPI003BAB668E